MNEKYNWQIDQNIELVCMDVLGHVGMHKDNKSTLQISIKTILIEILNANNRKRRND